MLQVAIDYPNVSWIIFSEIIFDMIYVLDSRTWNGTVDITFTQPYLKSIDDTRSLIATILHIKIFY